jgi:type IV secretory pathway VirB10-like protein
LQARSYALNRQPAETFETGKAMRKASGRTVQKSSRALTRALRLAAIALGIGLVMSAGAVRAQEDDEDDKTFEEKIIEGIMAGIGGTNMENKGIDYRERSPLVVPPKIDLPPPASASADVKAPNWPKDPDEQRRKAAIASRKKENKDPVEAARLLTPSELNKGKIAAAARTNSDPIQPGSQNNNPILSPSQLGYNGGFSGLFGGNKTETAPFKGEPTRDSLTQPPSGYQTPSPNFAYGTGPKESLNKEYNPSAGKYGE